MRSGELRSRSCAVLPSPPGLEVKAVNKDGQQQDLSPGLHGALAARLSGVSLRPLHGWRPRLHMLERSQDWENNAITMSRLVECSQVWCCWAVARVARFGAVLVTWLVLQE